MYGNDKWIEYLLWIIPVWFLGMLTGEHVEMVLVILLLIGVAVFSVLKDWGAFNGASLLKPDPNAPYVPHLPHHDWNRYADYYNYNWITWMTPQEKEAVAMEDEKIRVELRKITRYIRSLDDYKYFTCKSSWELRTYEDAANKKICEHFNIQLCDTYNDPYDKRLNKDRFYKLYRNPSDPTHIVKVPLGLVSTDKYDESLRVRGCSAMENYLNYIDYSNPLKVEPIEFRP